MRKKPFRLLMLLPVVAAFMAACTDQSDTTRLQATSAASQSVGFSTYTGRAGISRGGAYGAINTERLKAPGYGFGVFAYQTAHTAYADYRTQDATERHYPNFMYNEPIVWSSTDAKWIYQVPESVKYWPNDGQASFFAYAPYTAEAARVDVAAIDGQGVASADEGGIVRFSTANFNGGAADAANALERSKFSDPYLKYKLAPDSRQVVDLLWGTAQANGSSLVAGQPFDVNVDQTKETNNATVSLLFKHALSKVGGSYLGGDGLGSDDDSDTPTHGLMVVLDIDKNGHELGGSLQRFTGSTGTDDQTKWNTKVTVNEIVLESSRQLTDDGLQALLDNTTFDYDTQTAELYNTGIFNLATGIWTDHAREAYATASSHEQSIQPAEATDANPTTDADKAALLHPNIAEPHNGWTNAHTEAAFKALPIGVTTVPKNVYQNDAHPFVFIPGTHPVITITVDYTVRTFDAKLADYYTEVRQRITKRLYILDELFLNKQYNILIHLGLTSVKFTATVDDWELAGTGVSGQTDGNETDGTVLVWSEDVQHVYLPANVE